MNKGSPAVSGTRAYSSDGSVNHFSNTSCRWPTCRRERFSTACQTGDRTSFSLEDCQSGIRYVLCFSRPNNPHPLHLLISGARAPRITNRREARRVDSSLPIRSRQERHSEGVASSVQRHREEHSARRAMGSSERKGVELVHDWPISRCQRDDDELFHLLISTAHTPETRSFSARAKNNAFYYCN